MRTIKFRGKRIDNGEWVYGYVDATMYKDIVVIHTETGTFDVDPDTVGQFTGLSDKNGKEIYEGDIVQIKSLKGVVTWHPNGYYCIHTRGEDISETEYTPIGSLVDYIHREYYGDGLEIIGNIHDNHELKKGGEK